MKLKTKTSFVWDFCQMQGYLNTVDKITSKPVVNLERDVMYALARTGKKLKGDIEILQEKQEQRIKDLEPISIKCHNELTAKEDKEEEFKAYNVKFNDDWKHLMKTEIEVDVHAIKLSDIPKGVNLPEMFWNVLVEMVEESKEETK